MSEETVPQPARQCEPHAIAVADSVAVAGSHPDAEAAPGSAPVPTARPPRLRGRAVVAALAFIAAVLTIVSLGLGDYPLSPAQVVRALFDPSTGFQHTVVAEWRLPRIGAAVVLGAALAVSGALFQSLTDNPLGSPDVVGFSAGANAGAIVCIALLGTGVSGASVGALVGGLVTALLVVGLSYKRGLDSFRLIIIGIGTTACLYAVNQWLLLLSSTETAMSASIWGAGTLANVTPASVRFALWAVLVLLALTAVVSPGLRQLELGDDVARSHGVRATVTRFAIIGLAVALVAVAVAVAGPIAFVALTAPQIAKKLTGSSGIPLTASGLTGAILLLSADLLSAHVLPGGIPVGTVTIVLGGAYLVVLIMREVRRA